MKQNLNKNKNNYKSSWQCLYFQCKIYKFTNKFSAEFKIKYKNLNKKIQVLKIINHRKIIVLDKRQIDKMKSS